MDKIRKIAAFFLCAVLMTVAFSIGTFAQEDGISVLIDGEKVVFDAQPKMVNDRVMVPLRAIFEKLQAEVLWEEAFERVIVNFGESDQVVMYIGANRAFINGIILPLDSAPFVSEDRTYVPLRFIGESLGMSVEWDDSSKTVIITSADKDEENIK
ncbi:MAG: copper amine oxidase N-terminal domain-containing protein [Clostridia bacterium]|nr:copper amine oxidase N-terminal domain-containing protein [Clostridia bacterium]